MKDPGTVPRLTITPLRELEFEQLLGYGYGTEDLETEPIGLEGRNLSTQRSVLPSTVNIVTILNIPARIFSLFSAAVDPG